MTGLPFGVRSWLTGSCLLLCCLSCGCNRGGKPTAPRPTPSPTATESQPEVPANSAPTAVELRDESQRNETSRSANPVGTPSATEAASDHPPGVLFADAFADMT